MMGAFHHRAHELKAMIFEISVGVVNCPCIMLQLTGQQMQCLFRPIDGLFRSSGLKYTTMNFVMCASHTCALLLF